MCDRVLHNASHSSTSPSMASLVHQSYGKHCVRFSKIKRHGGGSFQQTHDFFEASVDIELEGDFDAAYLNGDNRLVVATDTCRNTIYAIAKDDPIDSLESFGCTLANHFLKQYSHVNLATVTLRQRLWHRMLESPHGFMGNDSETPTAKIVAKREGAETRLNVTAGIMDCVIAKTTESGFANFHQDEFRTLPDMDDRILATSLTASWTYLGNPGEYQCHRESIRKHLLGTFLNHYSRSVQETLYLMASAAIACCEVIETVTLTMPNKHHIRFNLEPLGRSNDNEIFVVTNEPFGFITATVARAEQQ
jgi:urate oxidase